MDSSAFCTTSCHTVHYPEAVTYETSPHSEVTCAQCHVGEGTSNLVVSKIKGLKEILPTLTGNYYKPIATPLADRRPTSQTCEKCHWSSKFSGDVPLIETSYLADANNTKSQFTLVLKVNGGLPEVAGGIHWHSTGKVWYISADDQRKQIVWVGVASGTVPSAPTVLTAAAANYTRVNLTWADNANNEAGFRIDRATNNSFTANLTSVSVAANTTSYGDTTVGGNV